MWQNEMRDNITRLSKRQCGFMERNNPCDALGSQISERTVDFFISEGGVSVLLRLLSDSDVDIRRRVLCVIKTLSYLPKGASALSRANGIVPLVQLLSDRDSRVKTYAGWALESLAQDSGGGIAADVSNAGAIVPLVRLICDSDRDVRNSAMGALKSLAATNHRANRFKFQTDIANAGAIVPLVRLLRAPSLEGSGVQADIDSIMKVLTRLAANHTTNQTAIASAGAVVALIRILNDSMSGGSDYYWMKRGAAEAFTALTTDHKPNQTAIANANGITLLVRLLSDTTFNYKECITEALLALSSDNAPNQTAIVRAGGIVPLVQLLDGYHVIGRIAVAILWPLTLNESNAEVIVDAGGLQAAERLLTKKEHNADTQDNARKIIAACQSIINKRQREQEQKMAAVPTLPDKVEPTAVHGNIAARELVMGRQLGRGGFGIVCEAIWQGVNKVAVKQLLSQTLSGDALEEFKREAAIHAQLKHPNIIALYGVCLEHMKYALVMELMARGSLYDVLHSASDLPWTMRINIALDTVAGLLYLHGRQILHRDLKSFNILLDESGRAKLSDFGLSKVKTISSASTAGPVGTVAWMAPELFDMGASCTAETDVYAVGIVFWEIISRKLPYEAAAGNLMQIMRHVESGQRERIPDGTPAGFAQLIGRCWAQRAGDRPAVAEIVREVQRLATGVPPPPPAADSGYEGLVRKKR